MQCPKAEICSFFNDRIPLGNGLGAVFKKKYCIGRGAKCARWLVLQNLGPEYVPDTLYPSMLDVAIQIIESATKS